MLEPSPSGRLGRFLRALAVSVAVGVLIELLLHWGQHSGRLGRIEALGADLSMAVFRNVQGPAPSTRVRPFVFVDVDEETYRRWERDWEADHLDRELLLIPRAHLARLIERVLAGRPRLLIVDVDLSFHDGVGDGFLAEALERHGRAGAETPVILARTLRPASAEAGSHYPQPHPSRLLDPVVARSPNLHWAGVWLRATPDAVIREWPLWQVVCAGDRPAVLPSVPLATIVLLAGPPGGLDDLGRELANSAPHNCTQPRRGPAQVVTEIDHTAVTLGEEGRILFSIPWRLPKGERRATIDGHGRGAPLLTSIPAQALLTAGEPPQPGGGLDGAIAVIGGSYADARDLYQTPLGPMPGALILARLWPIPGKR